MILITDVGSSKGHWILINKNKISKYKTSGFNPYISSDDDFSNIIDTLKKKFNFKKVKKIFYYGAGVKQKVEIDYLHNLLSQSFLNASINIESDLIGACRATCGNKRGVVSILGTGSNSCLYDGEKIIKTINSLGYIFGDEGSGFDMGRNFFKMYKRDLLPKDLSLNFKNEYDKKNNLLKYIYRQDNKSKFIANFSKFIFLNKKHPFINDFIRLHFEKYFDDILSKYDKNDTLNFSGSIGFYYKSYILKIAEEKGFKIDKIILYPIDVIYKFHSKKNHLL